MTYGKNESGQVVLTLSPEESQAFENDIAVIKHTVCSKGVVGIKVKKGIICPSAATRSELRALYTSKGDQTVNEAINFYQGVSASDYRAVIRDLNNFMQNVLTGTTKISEIMHG